MIFKIRFKKENIGKINTSYVQERKGPKSYTNHPNGCLPFDLTFASFRVLEYMQRPTNITTIYSESSLYFLNSSGIDSKSTYNGIITHLDNNEMISKATLKDVLLSYTIKELKSICKQQNLKVSGNKAQLVSRILMDGEYIINIINMYIITEKGKDFLNDNKDFRTLLNLSVYEMEEYINTRNELHKKGIVDKEYITIIFFTRIINDYFETAHFGGLYGATLLFSKYLLMIERKEEALEPILKAYLLLLSGLQNGYTITDFEFDNIYLDFFNILHEFDKNTVLNKMDEILSQKLLPFSRFTDKDVKDILFNFLNHIEIPHRELAKRALKAPYMLDYFKYGAWKDY